MFIELFLSFLLYTSDMWTMLANGVKAIECFYMKHQAGGGCISSIVFMIFISVQSANNANNDDTNSDTYILNY